MTTTLKVNEGEGCIGCPLYWVHGGECEADPERRDIALDTQAKPTWCPLKSGDVVVRLVRKGGV